MALTADQLQAIDRHLRKDNWLLNETLIAELTDHYIAGIDEQMIAGVSFEKALTEVHAGFGGRKGLLTLEEKFEEKPAVSVFPDFVATFLLYAKPPRLIFSLLLVIASYLICEQNLVVAWGRPVYIALSDLSIVVFLCVAGNLPLFGRPKFVTPAVLFAYKLSYPLNFTLISNGILYGTNINTDFVRYSLESQTALTFGYLLIWVSTIEFVISSLLRFKPVNR